MISKQRKPMHKRTVVVIMVQRPQKSKRAVEERRVHRVCKFNAGASGPEQLPGEVLANSRYQTSCLVKRLTFCLKKVKGHRNLDHVDDASEW